MAQAGPAAPTRSAGVLLATAGTTIASLFVRPQISSSARAPQAPTAPLEEPATASKWLLKQYGYRTITPCCHPLITHLGSCRSSDTQKLWVFPSDAVIPPGNYLEASKCSNCHGWRYHPPLLSPPLVTARRHQQVSIVVACGILPLRLGGYTRCSKHSHRTAITPADITPHEKRPPGDEKTNSNESCPLSPGYVRYRPTTRSHPER